MNAEINHLIRLGDDPWGDTMGVWFGIAETLYRDYEDIPADWQFRPSPVIVQGDPPDDDDDSWPECEIASLYFGGHVTADELRHAGNVLTRYAAQLKLAGLDY